MFTKRIAKPVILCIGTTNVVGDSLGPKVGDRLIEQYNVEAYVYGKSSMPVTGLNFAQVIEHIKTHHAKSVIIAVDACLGDKSDIGKVKYSMKGLCAGAALNKNLGVVGDLAMLGIVGERGENNLESLVMASPDTVAATADRVAMKIVDVLSTNYNYI
jgi:putative sporulation protein YyaC